MTTQRRIFVGSSGEATKLAEEIASAIAAAGMSPVIWNMGAFPAGKTLLERIESVPCEFDGAVLLATPDIYCTRGDETFIAPSSNVIFEYGYLSSRLTRRRVAICRFGEAYMPSDLAGVKVIEGKYVGYEAPEIPQDMKRGSTHGLMGFPSWLQAPCRSLNPMVTRVDGAFENRFDLWRGLPIKHPDSIYFHGIATLSIPPNGRGGTGIMYGATYILVQDYNARLDVVNEIRDATVDRVTAG